MKEGTKVRTYKQITITMLVGGTLLVSLAMNFILAQPLTRHESESEQFVENPDSLYFDDIKQMLNYIHGHDSCGYMRYEEFERWLRNTDKYYELKRK